MTTGILHLKRGKCHLYAEGLQEAHLLHRSVRARILINARGTPVKEQAASPDPNVLQGIPGLSGPRMLSQSSSPLAEEFGPVLVLQLDIGSIARDNGRYVFVVDHDG